MAALSISELERATGVPRSTIYYYVRSGLLPEAQKPVASRAVYGDVHVDLLGRIMALKALGRSLDQIGVALREHIAAAEASDIDLVAQRSEQTRRSIVEAAARLFARRGYKRTRVADIIKEARVSPPVFYSYFRSRRQLLLESLQVYVQWMEAIVEPPLEAEADPGRRELARMGAFLGLEVLSPDLLSLVRSEALHEGGETRLAAERAFAGMAKHSSDDLTAMRSTGPGGPTGVSDELVAHGLVGSMENIFARTSGDARYTVEDALRTNLFVSLAVAAAYRGEVDLSADLARYDDVIQRVATSPPPLPPQVG